jgi:hypothetical protein
MCSDRRKIAGYCLSNMCVHIERAATRVCYVSLTGVCSVSGVLYHLEVNVAEGDISCVIGEATCRLGLCFTFSMYVPCTNTICSSQGARKRPRYGHFTIGSLVHSLGFSTLASIVFRVEAYILRHAYNCRILSQYHVCLLWSGCVWSITHFTYLRAFSFQDVLYN